MEQFLCIYREAPLLCSLRRFYIPAVKRERSVIRSIMEIMDMLCRRALPSWCNRQLPIQCYACFLGNFLFGIKNSHHFLDSWTQFNSVGSFIQILFTKNIF
uniref:Ycf2 N-terminal domain-containing protein n=1 Tax=Solanum lycopersicum TaxID=4081 RepID=K4AUN8_SOLLC